MLDLTGLMSLKYNFCKPFSVVFILINSTLAMFLGYLEKYNNENVVT